MPKVPGQVFASALKTTIIKPLPHTLSTAALSLSLQQTSVAVPLSTTGPSQAIMSQPRNSVVITVPTDGKLVYVGTDANVSATSGSPVYPGTSIDISGYSGPVYILSSNGLSQVFVSVT